ncbi:MAG: DUF4340 domain-containing protein [Oscillibacter sp.]|nr:DUF4340 domain-containing protein [Oscillibacter sp.]
MSWQEKRVNAVLGVILGLLCLAVLIVLSGRYRAARNAEQSEGGETAQTAETAQADPYVSLACWNGKTELHFSFGGDKWRWDADPDFPLVSGHVETILSLLDTLNVRQTLPRGEDLSAYGLSSPSGRVTATTASGAQLLVELGSAYEEENGAEAEDASSVGAIYADINRNESSIYVIDDTLSALLQIPIYDLCRLPELTLPEESAISEITLAAPRGKKTEADVVTLTAQHAEGDGASVTWRSGGANVTDAPALRELLADLSAMAVTKCVDYRPSAEAAALCGFSDPAVLTVRYTGPTGTDDAFTLEVGGETLDGGGRYVRLDGGSAIYRMDLALLDPLLRIAAEGF